MRIRTPKNYSGTQNPGRKIGDLLPEVLSDLGCRCSDSKDEVFRFWFELMGEKMAPLTVPISLENGVLTVKVKSSTLYSLLVTHESPRLLKRLSERFSIKNIVFRVG